MAELLAEYANTVVTRAAVGDECARGLFDGGDRGREQRKVFNDFQALMGTEPVGELLPWLGWVDAALGLEAKVSRTFRALDGLLEKVIDDHRRRRRPPNGGDTDDGDRRDFVDVLLDVHEHDKQIGIQLETDEIKAIILDMFAGGTDTTSTAIEWAMAELVTPGRDPRGGRHRRRGPRRRAALPQGRGEGDAAAARAAAAAGAPGAGGGRRDPGLPGAGGDACGDQRVGHRPGPRRVGGRRGVRAGEVLAGHGRRRGLQGAGLQVRAVRRRQEGVPRARVGRGQHRDGARELAVPFRLGGGRRGRAVVLGHERDERDRRARQVRPAACS
ncbi:unnamed protein product [Urochloa humidicola]